MALSIDINCDMGEGMGNDAALMPYISSANISCGYHAGDAAGIRYCMQLAKQYSVAVGAHPSFKDKENFGRIQHSLSETAVYHIVMEQLQYFAAIAAEENVTLHHVKPHGALYNWSAVNTPVATAIAQVVKDFDDRLILYGLSGSQSLQAAKALGLSTASEVFADRTYQPDGRLTPRSQPDALLPDTASMLEQVLRIVREQHVSSTNGERVAIQADTICIHSDGPHAVAIAASIYQHLQINQIDIQAVRH